MPQQAAASCQKNFLKVAWKLKKNSFENRVILAGAAQEQRRAAAVAKLFQMKFLLLVRNVGKIICNRKTMLFEDVATAWRLLQFTLGFMLHGVKHQSNVCQKH